MAGPPLGGKPAAACGPSKAPAETASGHDRQHQRADRGHEAMVGRPHATGRARDIVDVDGRRGRSPGADDRRAVRSLQARRRGAERSRRSARACPGRRASRADRSSARETREPRASQAASPGRLMLATITSANATPRIGERIAQPRRSSTRPVNRSVRVADAHAANALRATMSVRIQVRAGAHASGSRAATASRTTPASPMIEYPTTCSMSSWIQRRDRRQQDRGDRDGQDDRPGRVEVHEQRRDGGVGPGQRNDGERRRERSPSRAAGPSRAPRR